MISGRRFGVLWVSRKAWRSEQGRAGQGRVVAGVWMSGAFIVGGEVLGRSTAIGEEVWG